ncbi:glycosyltransferase family 2 protein [Pseudomonas cerasi]
MIVIPMAGFSSRFFNAGYTKPKYMLEAHGKTLFEWSVSSFESYYKNEFFLFICRAEYDTPEFIQKQIEKIGIANYKIVTLDKGTRGQAETVYLGVKEHEHDESLLIFNIDTMRINFDFIDEECDGYLEVFEGAGEHWSFVEPEGDSNLVKKTTEKVRISNLCSNGIYYFKSKSSFEKAFESFSLTEGELYIAPMYNSFIQSGKKVIYRKIDEKSNVFMGTPAEYDVFLNEYNDV